MPASILTCRAGSISVVAEQLESAIFRYEQPRTRVWTSLSKMIRSGMRGRWHPHGWVSMWGGISATNWRHRGSMMKDGMAGTSTSQRKLRDLTPQYLLPGLVPARLNDTPLPAQPLSLTCDKGQ